VYFHKGISLYGCVGPWMILSTVYPSLLMTNLCSRSAREVESNENGAGTVHKRIRSVAEQVRECLDRELE